MVGWFSDYQAPVLWPTFELIKDVCFPPLPDLCNDKWVCEKPRDYLDESAQLQDLRGEDGDASEITYGEVEQRLDQLEEHLNR